MDAILLSVSIKYMLCYLVIWTYISQLLKFVEVECPILTIYQTLFDYSSVFIYNVWPIA